MEKIPPLVDGINLPDNEKESEESPEETLLKEQINVLKASTTKKYGAVNIDKVAEAFYQLMYGENGADKTIKELEIADSEAFPNKTKFLNTELSKTTGIPEKDHFIKIFKNALRKKIDFNKGLNEGAINQLEQMMREGPLRIWTAGDAKGEALQSGLKASWEQFYKIAPVVNPIRKKFAQESRPDTSEYLNRKRDSLRVYSSEKKIELVRDICQEFSEKGINVIVAIEDQLKMLTRLMEEIKKNGNFSIIPIWLRHGSHKNDVLEGKSIEECEKDFNAISSLEHLEIKWKGLIPHHAKIGFICDWDEVISNDPKRQSLQARAVYKALKKEGWIM